MEPISPGVQNQGVEDSLRARIRAGDREAFTRLFDEHADVVYRYAVRVTGDWSAAEEIVSITFLETWRLRERIHDDDDSLRPWILSIATNVLRNTRRKASRYRALLARLPGMDPLPDFSDEVIARMAEVEEIAAAHAALSTLRRREREIIALCVWDGLSYAEAAQALNIPVGTVRSRLSRAKARLRSAAQPILTGRGGIDANNATAGIADMEPRPTRQQIQGGGHSVARSTRGVGR